MTPSRRTPPASWLVTLRSLCQFAVKRGWLRADPTRDIKQRSIKGDGFHTWTDDEIAQFEAHHPIGTKPRLALALLLYTAQRRSDVVRMGRQHIKDGVLTVKQQKTGVTLAIPVHPRLADGARRHAERTSDVPGHRDRQAIRRQRISASSFETGATPPDYRSAAKPHGLRKAACRRLAEAGCSANEIMSISGHTTMKEIVRYTVAADQARLARNAFAKAVIR